MWYSFGSIIFTSVLGGTLALYPKIGEVLGFEFAQSKPSYGLSVVCDYRADYQFLDECKSGNNPNTLLWGDSYAMHLARGLSENVALIQATKHACSPNILLT